ncbi:hypothetical protein BJ742DRAFT_474675 [Cladochytrium replicatum]|nr:hypothetical protein BJ742DRAFT_474675 [Cladochytrium replicatum]
MHSDLSTLAQSYIMRDRAHTSGHFRNNERGCDINFTLEPDLFGIGARTAFTLAAYCPILLWWTIRQKPDTITAHFVALAYIISCASKYSQNQLHPINTLIALNIASLWFAAGQTRVAVTSRKASHKIPRNLIRIGQNAVKVWVWAIMPQELSQAGCTDLVYAKIFSVDLTLTEGYRTLQIALSSLTMAQGILELVEIKFYQSGEREDLIVVPYKWRALFRIHGPPREKHELKCLETVGLKRVHAIDIVNLAGLMVQTVFLNITIFQRLGDGAVDNWTIGQVFALAAAVGTSLGTVFNSYDNHLEDLNRLRRIVRRAAEAFLDIISRRRQTATGDQVLRVERVQHKFKRAVEELLRRQKVNREEENTGHVSISLEQMGQGNKGPPDAPISRSEVSSVTFVEETQCDVAIVISPESEDV